MALLTLVQVEVVGVEPGRDVVKEVDKPKLFQIFASNILHRFAAGCACRLKFTAPSAC